MSAKRYSASVAAAALLTLAVAGCGSNGGNAGSALATSSAVAKAKAQVDTCVRKTGATALLSSSGRSEFIDCMKTLVSPAKQEQFKNCITSAAQHDQLWTSSGRSKFTSESLPNCIDAAA